MVSIAHSDRRERHAHQERCAHDQAAHDLQPGRHGFRALARVEQPVACHRPARASALPGHSSPGSDPTCTMETDLFT
jgi:hypothetical protein